MPQQLALDARSFLRQALDDPSADFRADQWDAIEALVVRRERLLIVQRTGWGKSMVYFLATRLLRSAGEGLTILISPLLSLMRNQVGAAARIGLVSRFLNYENAESHGDVVQEVQRDEVDLLIVTPERFANEDFRQNHLLAIAQRVGLFVIDEAHCISDWGHDFRVDYRRIGSLLPMFPRNTRVIATTATANQRVVDDTLAQLGPPVTIIRGPLARASLKLQNIDLPSQAARMAWLAENVPTMPGSGIIYALTVKDAERVAAWLQSRGIDAHPYFGDLPGPTKETLEQKLLGNELKALVATSALGMGFDKPDLGFVIHFQRPGSVVHYYQQVGRAGRALEAAFGILLCGNEDDEITNYFIETAFPPEAHVAAVLEALEEADDGLSTPMLEKALNLSRPQIDKVLKLLGMEAPAPVAKIDRRWHRTAFPYTPDTDKIEKLTRLRRSEQETMRQYMASTTCLMAFLQRELDDPTPTPCGRCAPCLGQDLISSTAPLATVNDAVRFLKHSDHPIEARKLWIGDSMASEGWKGRITDSLRAEEGCALSIWGDAGWGDLVRNGKLHDGRFDEALVEGAVNLVRSRWDLLTGLAWVTCVPSLTRPDLVPDFASRLANGLGLPFVSCVRKVAANAPQRKMLNGYQQARNVAGAFAVDSDVCLPGPVLLVDDSFDSRWTLTVVAALLRHARSGPVFPFALAVTLQGKGG